MLYSRMLFMAALLGTAAAAQVPTNIAAITNLDVSSGSPQMEYQNTGSKALTAIVIKNLTPEHKGEVVMAEYPSAPLAPGQTRSLPVWSGLDAGKLASEVEIAAVIFADGTHLGSAPNPAYNNVDALDEIFELRRATAAALAKWAAVVNTLPADDRAALEKFVSADPGEPKREFQSQTAIGAADIQSGMHQLALKIKQALVQGADPHTLRVKYLGHIPAQAAMLAKAAQEVSR